MKEWKVTEVEESETDWNWCSNEIEVESETRVDFMGAFSALLEPRLNPDLLFFIYPTP